MIEYDQYPSPMGVLYLSGCGGSLTHLSFEKPAWQATAPAAEETYRLAKRWLEDYFRGCVRETDFPMNPQGTPFQQMVWKLLLEIPYGHTKTYGELAREVAAILGREKMSAQAVGQAVGKNPIAIIIPCHRCIGTGGQLTGYAYGLEKKQWLLEHEQNGRLHHAVCGI